jgi:hypothetical protein
MVDTLLTRNEQLSEALGVYKELCRQLERSCRKLKREQESWRGEAVYLRKAAELGLSPE